MMILKDMNTNIFKMYQGKMIKFPWQTLKPCTSFIYNSFLHFLLLLHIMSQSVAIPKDSDLSNVWGLSIDTMSATNSRG